MGGIDLGTVPYVMIMSGITLETVPYVISGIVLGTSLM